MRIIEQVYIEGAFVMPHGEEFFDLFKNEGEKGACACACFKAPSGDDGEWLAFLNQLTQ